MISTGEEISIIDHLVWVHRHVSVMSEIKTGSPCSKITKEQVKNDAQSDKHESNIITNLHECIFISVSLCVV